MKMENRAKAECREIATKLATYLKSPETKRKMFNWHEG